MCIWPQHVCASGTSTSTPTRRNRRTVAFPTSGIMPSTRQVTSRATRTRPFSPCGVEDPPDALALFFAHTRCQHPGVPGGLQQPRVEPLEPPYDDDARAALDLLGPPILLFRVWARRPDLARAVAGWGSYSLPRRSALSIRQRELIID